jgi:hypothetical protein
MCPDSFNVVQERYPDLVATDSTGSMTGSVVDFCESFRTARVQIKSLIKLQSIGSVTRCVPCQKHLK